MLAATSSIAFQNPPPRILFENPVTPLDLVSYHDRVGILGEGRRTQMLQSGLSELHKRFHTDDEPKNLPLIHLELLQRAHSPQLAAGLASESKNCKIPYSRREALPEGRTFPAACCRELQ